MLLTHQAGTFPRAAPQPAQRLSVRACASKPALASSLHRRTALSWLSLSTFAAGGAARAQEDSFEPAKKLSTEYTTLEKSYKEKDETTAGDVGRFAAFSGAFALVVAFLTNSPTEIARRIALAKKEDEARLSSDPLYVAWKAAWAVAIKEAADKSV